MPSSSKTLIPFPTARRDGILTTLFLSFFLISTSSLFTQPVSPQYAKVLCLRASSGCECRNPITQSLTRFFHGEAVIVDLPYARDEYVSIRNEAKRCLFPKNNLKFLTYKSGFQPMETKKDHSPKPLEFLLYSADEKELKNLSSANLGRYYPTYYHLALEEAYPGTIVSVLSPSGKEIGKASASFLEQVRWEGSGVAKDGTKYHFAGDGRFETYDLEWGWGAGYGFQVFPYRTLAVSFRDLCAKMGNRIPNCNKSKVIGSLALIPKIREKRIRMPDGKFHDGFFCINDTGSPMYIRGDRVDIFVGTHGGGSPYQPKELSRNVFLDAGIQPLVPWDWRFYTSEKEREWCSEDKLPKDPFSPKAGECDSDYHANAPEKGMDLYVFFRKDGSLVRCRS